MAGKKGLFSRLGTYLTEIVIIIIGITISFAMDDWEKKRSARTDYQNYLVRLQQDIRIDSTQIQDDVGSYARKIKGVDLIFAFRPDMPQDSIALLGRAQDNLLNYVEFLPNDNTFQVLSSTGDFRVFENDSLVSELFQLYDYDYAFIAMLGREANGERNDLLKPYLIDNIYFEDKLTFPLVRTDIAAVIGDRKFRNICLDYKESCYGAINSYRRAMDRMRNINAIIRSELDRIAGE